MTLDGLLPVDRGPCLDVSYYEADAFALGRQAAADGVRVGGGAAGVPPRQHACADALRPLPPVRPSSGSSSCSATYGMTRSAYQPYPATPPLGAVGSTTASSCATSRC